MGIHKIYIYSPNQSTDQTLRVYVRLYNCVLPGATQV